MGNSGSSKRRISESDVNSSEETVQPEKISERSLNNSGLSVHVADNSEWGKVEQH